MSISEVLDEVRDLVLFLFSSDIKPMSDIVIGSGKQPDLELVPCLSDKVDP